MTARRMHQHLWNFIALSLVLLGVVGSLGAWEQGSIGFVQMLAQSCLFAALARSAFQRAACFASRRATGCPRRTARRAARAVTAPAA